MSAQLRPLNKITPEPCSHGLVDVRLYKGFRAFLYITTPSAVKPVQVKPKLGDRGKLVRTKTSTKCTHLNQLLMPLHTGRNVGKYNRVYKSFPLCPLATARYSDEFQSAFSRKFADHISVFFGTPVAS